MNNLKRILCLALASVMVMAMMVVGASATSFEDDGDIENKAAVETMVALKIIDGMDPEHFNPKGLVTRAQMAKMITFALNGGKDIDYGLKNNGTFKDVPADKWYAEYVEYCASLGIIGGYGDGTFKPEQNVTGQEAAKMMLVALGYDADIFGFTGAKWATNVDAYAASLTTGTEKKDEDGKGTGEWNGISLYTNVAGQRTLPLTRDDAAQLIYNGLNANTVSYTVTGVQSGAPVFTYNMHDKSLLESKFNASVKTGTLTSAVYTRATSTTAASWTYTVAGVGSIKTAQDVSDLFMQTVRVVQKGNTTLSITPASGVASEGVVADLVPGGVVNNAYYTTLDGLRLAGTNTNITNLDVYTFLNGTSSKLNLGSLTPYHQYRLILDNTGRLACMVIIPMTVDIVRSTASDSVRLTTAGKIDLKGNDIAEGLATGDYVIVNQHPQTKAYTVTKAATITGTVDAVREGQIRVDGTWYDSVDSAAQTTLAALLGKESNLVLVGQLLFTGEAVKEAEKVSEAVMAVKIATASTTINGDIDTNASSYVQVRVLKADKSVEVLKVVKVGDAAATPDVSVESPSNVTAGTLYTYTLDNQGYATLTAYAAPEGTLTLTNPTTNDGVATGTAAANAPTSYRFNDDATIFVYVAPVAGDAQTAKPEQYTVLSGKDVNAWGKTAYAATGTLYGAKAANGFTYASLGALKMASIPGAGADTATYYGIVTADASRIYNATEKKYFLEVAVWNGAENTTIHANGDATAANVNPALFEEGTVVSYTVNANGSITLAKIVAGGTTTIEAVEAFDGISTIKFVGASGKEYDISKATISYVDTAKAQGENGNTIPLADLVDEDDINKGYVPNVWVIWSDTSADKTIKAIIVETNNEADDTAVGEHQGTEVAGMSKVTTAAMPAAGETTTLAKDEDKKITGVYNDTIVGTPESGTAWYTFGIFENDIKDTTSTEWYVFQVVVNTAGNWKLERFNDGSETAARTSGPVEITTSETFAMICGNQQNVTYKLTKIGTPAVTDSEGNVTTPAVEDVVYTFTWTK